MNGREVPKREADVLLDLPISPLPVETNGAIQVVLVTDMLWLSWFPLGRMLNIIYHNNIENCVV